ncbi:Aldehyde dehydrogenase [Ceratocystis lukuohia]|uniref:Aldehyde dehydrogenase n=1 Tax=Ceratocystis lukuohia TaxID=2019550 RepID=A0ABR4MUI3_9PEZI
MSHPVSLTAPNGVTWSQPTGLFINNEFVPSSNGQTIQSTDPATEEPIVSVSAATADDIDTAVKAAAKALKSAEWKDLSDANRGKLLWKLADLLEENKKLFATIDAWSNGKTYAEALAIDMVESVSTLRYYAGWCDKIHGQTIVLPNKLAYTLRQPIGVVGQIIPWNYPMNPGQGSWLPPGVVNFVNGYGKEAGGALVEHPLVDKIAFTGSTTTATHIMAAAAKTLKNITLETGGKSPLLVFEDADMDQAVKWSHMGIMSNQGQICTATSRLLVQKSVYADFVAQFIDRVKAVSVTGSQWAEGVYQGPQVSKAQKERVLSYIQAGKDAGATVALGGGVPAHLPKGYYVEATVFTDVTPDMAIFKEEIFGPVVVIMPFETEEEAIKLANSTSYGLGAAVFTTNLERSHRVAADIETGMVWINSTQDCDPHVPFGGVKQSGIGRELGEAGLEAYTQIKSVHINMGTRF